MGLYMEFQLKSKRTKYYLISYYFIVEISLLEFVSVSYFPFSSFWSIVCTSIVIPSPPNTKIPSGVFSLDWNVTYF